jgi:Transcription factor WhiB
MNDLFDVPAFFASAACRGLVDDIGPTERDRLFFPSRGQAVGPGKQVCAGCPVREECADYAIAHHIREGIWGGLSSRERRKVARERNTPYKLPPIAHGTYGGFGTHVRRGELPCWACIDARERYIETNRATT